MVQVSNITNIGHNKNITHYSMRPLIWLLKIFCLNCNLDHSTFKSYYLFFKIFFTIAVIGIINFSSFYYKVCTIYNVLRFSVRLTDTLQIFYDFGQYVVDVYFVYIYGRHISIQYYKQYECIDEILHITSDSGSTLKKKLIKVMAFLFTIWAISSVSDFLVWKSDYGVMVPLSHSIIYLFLFIKILTILHLIAHVMHIELRLQIIGEIVKACHCSLSSDSTGAYIIDYVSNKRWLYSRNKGDDTRMTRFYTCGNLKSLSKCYLILTEQVAFINKMYGVRILVHCLSVLIELVKLSNIAIIFIIDAHNTQSSQSARKYLAAIATTFRLLTCGTIMVTLVNYCELAYRQRESIFNLIDHLLITKEPDTEQRTTITKLRTLIQERPIYFNMANFITLNYSLLMSIASVVVTYTIILLQN